MSEKREFPILNGKLLSDLDLNGHKLLGSNIPEGGGGGGSSVIVDDTLTKDGENPVKSKGIWSAIWGAIAAPAASVYEWVTTELGKKQDKLKQGDNITIADDGTISASGGSVDVVAEIAGKEIKPSSVVMEDGDDTLSLDADSILRYERGVDGDSEIYKCVRFFRGIFDIGLELKSQYIGDHANTFKISPIGLEFETNNLSNDQQRRLEMFVWTGTVSYSGPEGEAENTIANMVNAMPRYRFVDAEIVDGVVTIAPYTNAKLTSDGTAFTVSVGEGSGYARDCVLYVECGETTPRIVWDSIFHPRTDRDTDFACEAGVRNVYWITEYADGKFVVAGWQETTGGNAE